MAIMLKNQKRDNPFSKAALLLTDVTETAIETDDRQDAIQMHGRRRACGS